MEGERHESFFPSTRHSCSVAPRENESDSLPGRSTASDETCRKPMLLCALQQHAHSKTSAAQHTDATRLHMQSL